MTKITIELADATAKAAREAGLLTPQAIERLLVAALERQRAGDALLSIADKVAAGGAEAMTMEEIDSEVKDARVERRTSAGRH